MPAVSIISPTFNRLEFIIQMIDSISKQSFQDWELLIVDDGSEKETVQFLSEISKSNDKIKFIQRNREPKSASTCRNIGWHEATSERIVFLDSDDLMAPWCLQERLSVAKGLPNVDLIIFEALEFDNEDPKHHRLRSLQHTKNPLQEFLNFEACWQTSCVLWNKKSLEKISGWDEGARSWQDGEVHIRALKANESYTWAGGLPDVFIRKYYNEYRISSNRNLNKLINLIATYEKIEEVLDNCERAVFKKNYINIVFSLMEIMRKEDVKKFTEYLRNRENKLYKHNTLLFYARVVSFSKIHPFVFKIIYQLRKFGLPNRRKIFFAKRKYLKEKDFVELKSKILNSNFKLEQIKFLTNIQK